MKIGNRHYYIINISKIENATNTAGVGKYEYEKYMTKRVSGKNFVGEFEYGLYRWWLELIVYNQDGSKSTYDSNTHSFLLSEPRDVPFGVVFENAISGLKYQTEPVSSIFVE